MAALMKRRRANPASSPMASQGKRLARVSSSAQTSQDIRTTEQDLTLAERRRREKSSLVINHTLLSQPTSATGYHIRPMQFQDCAPCFHLGEKVFTSQFPNLYRLWDEYEVIDAFSTDSNKCFVAVTSDKKIIGFIFGDEIRKRNSVRYGYIHWIAVDPMYRRRGVGTALYNCVAPLMQDSVRMILCDTPADNYVARQFFEKLGFGDPINHVYMSRNLSQMEPSSSSNENQASSGGGNDDEREAETPSRRMSRRSVRGGENGREVSPRISPTATATPLTAHKKRRKYNVDVREMIIDDLHEVYELGEGVFGDRSSPNLFRFWEPAEVLDLFETDSEFCLVAELNDKIVGFCLGTTIKKKRSAWKYGYLIWLAVAPGYQGAGIGMALYEHFQELAIADGCRMIFIDTQADSPAVKFWRRMGFGHSQAHVFMSKNLRGGQPDRYPDSARGVPGDADDGAAPMEFHEFAPPPEGDGALPTPPIRPSRSVTPHATAATQGNGVNGSGTEGRLMTRRGTSERSTRSSSGASTPSTLAAGLTALPPPQLRATRRSQPTRM